MIEQETETFTTACRRLAITATKAPAIFDVTRQTFSSWIHGKTKIPHRAFIALLEFENRDFLRTSERMVQIRETAALLNKKALLRDQSAAAKD